uniref:Uncharacterized protein LOC102808653 n=1 Tax=Saccoglossus kowalevskii TaxID=10224 RepID=A0ABM0MPE2_SACKO|nr:PREDICTED: uncharacterized protein LOC102808653 [Saccoglossus kowalevskii]
MEGNSVNNIRRLIILLIEVHIFSTIHVVYCNDIRCNSYTVNGGSTLLIDVNSSEWLYNLQSSSYTFARIEITPDTSDSLHQSLEVALSPERHSQYENLSIGYNSQTSNLIISGQASSSVYSHILQRVRYNNTADQPSLTTRRIVICLYSGQHSAEQYVCNLTINANKVMSTAIPLEDISNATLNNNCLLFSRKNISVSVIEESPIGTEILSMRTDDPDSHNNKIQYILQYSSNSDLFDVGFTTGVVKTAAILDREENAAYDITVIANDAERECTSITNVRIVLLDINDNSPYFENRQYMVSFGEDFTPSSTVIQITATDLDIGENGSVSYYMEPNNYFGIDSTSGVVSLLSAVDFDTLTSNPLKFNIYAKDHGSISRKSVVKFVALVSDVNDNAPTFAMDKHTITIDSEFPKLQPLCRLNVTDLDSGHNAIVHLRLRNDYNIFGISYENALILTQDSVLALDQSAIFRLEIVAEDNGKPPLSTIGVFTVIIETNSSNNCTVGDDIATGTYNFLEGQHKLALNVDMRYPDHVDSATVSIVPCRGYGVIHDYIIDGGESAICSSEIDKLGKVATCGFTSPILVSDKNRVSVSDVSIKSIDGRDRLTFNGVNQYAIYKGDVPRLPSHKHSSLVAFLWFTPRTSNPQENETSTLFSKISFTASLLYSLQIGYNQTLCFHYRTQSGLKRVVFGKIGLNFEKPNQLTFILNRGSNFSVEIYINRRYHGVQVIEQPLIQNVNGFFYMAATPTTDMKSYFKGSIDTLILSEGPLISEHLRCVLACRDWLRVDHMTTGEIDVTFNQVTGDLSLTGAGSDGLYRDILHSLVYINVDTMIPFRCREISTTITSHNISQQNLVRIEFLLMNDFVPVLLVNGHERALFTATHYNKYDNVYVVNTTGMTLTDEDGGVWPYTLEVTMETERDPHEFLNESRPVIGYLCIRNLSAEFRESYTGDGKYSLSGLVRIDALQNELHKLVFITDVIDVRIIFKFVIVDGVHTSSPVYSVFEISSENIIQIQTLTETNYPAVKLNVSSINLFTLFLDIDSMTSLELFIRERFDGTREFLICNNETICSDNNTSSLLMKKRDGKTMNTLEILNAINNVRYFNYKMKNIYKYQPNLKTRRIDVRYHGNANGEKQTRTATILINLEATCKGDISIRSNNALTDAGICSQILSSGGLEVTCDGHPASCDVMSLKSLANIQVLCLIP